MEKSKRKFIGFLFPSRFSALVCAAVVLTLLLVLSVRHMPRSLRPHTITVRSAAKQRVILRGTILPYFLNMHYCVYTMGSMMDKPIQWLIFEAAHI